MLRSIKVLAFFALFALTLHSANAKKKKLDFYSASNQDNKGMQKANGRNQMDAPKTVASETGKIKKMMAEKLPNFKVSIPAVLPSGPVAVPSPLLAVQSPVLSVSSSSPTKKKMKMGKKSTVEPVDSTVIPTSPPNLSVPAPSPPPSTLEKVVTKDGNGMGMSKNPPRLDLPTYLPSATPVPSNTIPSASPVPSNNIPPPSLGMGKMM